jgi:YVTN family beta-propeller protein
MRLAIQARALALCSMLAAQALAAPYSYVPGPSNNILVIDVADNSTVADIPVGVVPSSPAVNPAGSRVYVPNYGSNTVSVIDTASSTVIATIPVGTNPQAVVTSPDGSRAYVSARYGASISVIDAGSNTVTASIPVAGAVGMDLLPDGSRLYTCTDSGVSVVDTATNTVTSTLPLGYCFGLRVNPAGTELYVPMGDGTTRVLSTATHAQLSSITMPSDAYNAIFHPDGSRAYVANFGAGSVSVIDTATRTINTTIAVGAGPVGMAASSDGSVMHVLNGYDQTLSVVDLATLSVTATLTAGSNFGPSIFMVGGLEPAPFDPLIAIAALRDEINGLGLTDTRLRNSLLAPLNSAYNWLSGSDPNRVSNACSQLAKFVSVVGQNYSYGKLTYAVASALVLEANAIRVELGCRNPNSGTILPPV